MSIKYTTSHSYYSLLVCAGLALISNTKIFSVTHPQVISLDVQWRERGFLVDTLKKDKNRFQKEVAKAKKAGGEDPENAAKIKEVVAEIKTAEATLGEQQRGRRELEVKSVLRVPSGGCDSLYLTWLVFCGCL